MDSTQRLANEMDLKLFNLMMQADRLSDDSRIQDEADNWSEVVRLISSARNRVRRMMHPADLEKAKI